MITCCRVILQKVMADQNIVNHKTSKSDQSAGKSTASDATTTPKQKSKVKDESRKKSSSPLPKKRKQSNEDDAESEPVTAPDESKKNILIRAA